MAKKPDITTIASGYYSRQALNTNFTNLQNGFDNTLSLDGSTPNAMGADLDMNSNDILNASEIDTSSLRINGVLVSPSAASIQSSVAASNVFVGDGSTTAYTLSYEPFIKDNTQVYIDGVYQNKVTYNTSGTTLTFTEAPPLNSQIEVMISTTLTDVGTAAASAVTYNQGGTGAVNSTVQTKLQEVVSVKDFGAVGDGVTDDATAFANAWAASNPLAVFVPKGTYKLTGTTAGKFFSNGAVTISGGAVSEIVNLHKLKTSSDDTILDNWKLQETPIDAGFLSVAWSEDLELFCAVGGTSENGIITSPDGINWTERTMPLDQQWAEVIYADGPDVFVAVAISGTTQRVMTSANGTAWTARTTPNVDIRSVAHSPTVGSAPNGRLVAVGNQTSPGGNRVYTSDDAGVTWTERSYTFAHEDWVSAEWATGLNLFICTAVNTINGPVMTSPDGITWTRRDNGSATTHASENWQASAWSTELNMLAVVTNTGTQRVYTSHDGITFTARTTPNIAGFGNPSYHDIVWASEIGQFVAVANTGLGFKVMSSADGITWTARNTPNKNFGSWEGLAWSPSLKRFAAVADNTQPTVLGNHVMSCSVGDWGHDTPNLIYADRQLIRYQQSLQSVTSSTTLVDSDLAQEFEAGTTVTAHFSIRYDASTAGDIKFTVDKLSGTGTASGQFGVISGAAFNTSGTWARVASTALAATISVAGNGAGSFSLLDLWARVTITGGRTKIGFQFAQNASDGTATRLSDLSSVIFTESKT